MKVQSIYRKSLRSGAFAAAVLLPCCVLRAGVTVRLDPSQRHQTILGWGADSSTPPWATEALCKEIAFVMAREFGLNRLRIEPPGGNRSDEGRWERYNDNGDPTVMNWSAVDTRALDRKMTRFVLTFKAQVEARGDPFDAYVSPSFFNGGSTGKVPAWLLHSPGEYAEYALSLLSYLSDRYGIHAAYYCILNEAGNNNPFTAEVVASMIKVLGPALEAKGFSTKVQFPECVNARRSWDYVTAVRDDGELWCYVAVVSYHLYGSNDPYRSYLRDYAESRNLPTAQTEFMWLTMDHLYDDLTKGGVSYWEIYGTGSQIKWGYNGFKRKSTYWKFRQVINYVRPGAVRIGASSADPSIRLLAFEREGKTTTVLINKGGAKEVTIRGIPNGAYGVCATTGGGPYRELGVRAVGEGTLTVNLESGAVLTVYPHPEADLPPVPTAWEADREYLTLPRSSVTLSASAQDPELDPISYRWEVTEKPRGAAVMLEAPTTPRTRVTGMNVPGLYRFTVSLSDGVHTVSREVRVSVFAENQPPLPLDVHNRLPVEITLPHSSTSLRGGGWDLEGDPLSFRWRIVRRPEGAAVVLSDPTSTKCQASGMTVPGEYVFAFDVNDGKHVVTAELTVPVHPPNRQPVIKSLLAQPAELTLPSNSVTLRAETSDPDGDVITHWWSLKQCPSGAEPAFSTPGKPTTTVEGLTVPGTYIFTLTVIDRTKYTNKEVSVTVKPAPRDTSFRRGDANADGALNIADPIFLLKYLFAGGRSPSCADAGDGNDDGRLDISDAVALLAVLFGAKPSLPEPFLQCGSDPSPDELSCRSFAPCA